MAVSVATEARAQAALGRAAARRGRRRPQRAALALALVAAAFAAGTAAAFAGGSRSPIPARRGLAAAAKADADASADGELGQTSRRDFAAGVVGPALAGQVAVAALLQSPAFAQDTMSMIIAESRRKAKEDAKKPSIWNPNSYKTPTGKYDATNIAEFLPTVYLAKRQFEVLRQELDNPKVNVSEPMLFDTLRELNREEPTKLLRKDAYRTKLWLVENVKNSRADSPYERIKVALDEEDTQCLLLSRTDGLVDPAAVRTTKRNVDNVIDAIDQLLELIPVDDQVAAKAVADTKAVPAVSLPLNDRDKPKSEKPKEEKSAEAKPAAKPEAEKPAAPASKVPFASLSESDA